MLALERPVAAYTAALDKRKALDKEIQATRARVLPNPRSVQDIDTELSKTYVRRTGRHRDDGLWFKSDEDKAGYRMRLADEREAVLASIRAAARLKELYQQRNAIVVPALKPEKLNEYNRLLKDEDATKSRKWFQKILLGLILELLMAGCLWVIGLHLSKDSIRSSSDGDTTRELNTYGKTKAEELTVAGTLKTEDNTNPGMASPTQPTWQIQHQPRITPQTDATTWVLDRLHENGKLVGPVRGWASLSGWSEATLHHAIDMLIVNGKVRKRKIGGRLVVEPVTGLVVVNGGVSE